MILSAMRPEVSVLLKGGTVTFPDPPRRHRRHWDVFLGGTLVKDLDTLTRIAYGKAGVEERARTAHSLLGDTRRFCDIPAELIAECRREVGLPEGQTDLLEETDE
ncbi:hypothetical protein [Nonomuraea sp. NPDC001831]|uniref:hypothetical protein n=1 Tax=Nonomuraea sp. NPDC001831 TaxID=3364340 RepID=UPI0036A08BEC